MLQVGHFRLDGIGRASTAQTCQWEVIMQCQNLLDIVETFDVLIGFRVVCTAVDVLQHVHVSRDIRLPTVRMFIIVPEVNVTEVVTLRKNKNENGGNDGEKEK